MNRNELFRKSLLSTAVVAILHTYSMGAAAAPCPDPVDGGITISSGETCDTITISDDNLANVITVGGTVDGDIINTTGLEFFKVLVGPEGDRDITGSVINRGELILPDGIGTENDYSLFLAGDNLDDDDDSNDLILSIGGDVINEGTATYLEVEYADIGGDLINSGTLTHDYLIVRDTAVAGSVVNSGTIGSTETPVFDAIWIDSSAIGGDVLNEGYITGDNIGIHISETDIAGDVENSGNITLTTQGEHYQQVGMFGIQVTNVVPSDGPEGFEILGESTVGGSVINSGTITITDADPESPALIEDMVGGIFVGVELETQETPAAYVTGDVINTGEIHVEVHNHEYGETFGILVENANVTGRVGNVGEDSVITSSREGIIVADDSTVGDVVNEGTITSTGFWDGIYVDESTAASISNNGTINTTIGSGININASQVNGTIRNDGTINASGGIAEYTVWPDETTPPPEEIEGSGIYVSAFTECDELEESCTDFTSTTGSIINGENGTINATDNGIDVDSAVINGSIINQGTIAADLGIYADSTTISGDVINSGLITGYEGIYLESSENGTTTLNNIVNDTAGKIQVEELGIAINGIEANSVVNNGQITVAQPEPQDVIPMVYDDSFGAGIFIRSSDIAENVTNNGDIDVFGTGIALDSWGEGQTTVQYVLNNADATIEAGNSGIVLSGVDATGIVNLGSIQSGDTGIDAIDSDLAEGVYNDGQINAVYAGIVVEGDEDTAVVGTVVNDENGVITIQATDEQNDGGPNFGIGLFEVSGESLVNAGTINSDFGLVSVESMLTDGVLNTGTINGQYAGIILEGVDANVASNFGTINLADEDSVGIYIGGSSLETGVYNEGSINAADGISIFGWPMIRMEEPELLSIGSVVNAQSGVINASSTGIDLENVASTGLANAGTIRSNGDGINIYGSELTSLSNSGTITSANDVGIHVRQTDITKGMINEAAGTISGDYAGIFLDGVTVAEGLTNNGTIEGRNKALWLFGSVESDITNNGIIQSSDSAAIYAESRTVHDGTLTNSGLIIGGEDGENRTAIDYSDASSDLSLIQKAGQIIGSIFGRSEASSDSAYIDGGSITGDLHDIEGIYVDGVTTLDGNVYGGTFINIESNGNLTLTGEARSFESDLNLYGGTLSLNISNETKPAEAMLTTEGEIYLSSDSRLIITASQNLEVNLDPVDYLALSGSALYHNGVTVESGSAIITAELAEVTEDSLSVTVATNDFGQVIESVGATGNEVQVIDAYMQEYIASSGGECNAICQAIEQAETAEELAAIAEEMVPDSSGVVGASQAAQSETLGAVFKRIAGFRSSVSGVSSGDNIEPGSLWMQALASDGDQEAVQYQGNDFDGYSYRTRGFTIGADADLSDTLTAGLAVTYGVTKSDVEGSANRSETDSYLLTANGSWRQQDYFMDSSIAFGVSRSDIEQYTANVKSTADSDAAQVALRLVTGRTFAFNDNDTIVEPQVAFNYSRVDTDSYTLQPLNMEVLDQRIETVELGAGLRAMTAIDTKRGLLIPEVNLMAWHDFAADRGDTAARFLSGAGNSFVTTGAKPEQTNYQAGLGVQYWLNNNVSLSANYDRNWNSNFSADTWLANIRYDF
ncbi:autotransporter domain-containing protein [Endozoicomonas atrinae]|uniref:autotransporter domain-containing protein n=1 Tax=Endozoicomonas atrinae TaxID=1333660 RepID=UPI003B005772